jgi:two-component system sensor histidine kinase YesM
VKGKFFILTVALTILPMLILGLIFYNIIIDKMEKKAKLTVLSSLQGGVYNMNRGMGELDDLTRISIINPQLQEMITNNSEDYYTHIQNIYNVKNLLYTINQSKSYISNYLIYRRDAVIGFNFFQNVGNFPYVGVYSYTLVTSQSAEKVYKELADNGPNIWYKVNPFFDDSTQIENNNTMLYIKKIKSLTNNFKDLGFLMLEVNIPKFFSGISYLNLPTGSNLFWMDTKSHRVIYEMMDQTTKTDFRSMIKQMNFKTGSGSFVTKWLGTKYMVTYVTDNKTNLRGVHIIELNQLFLEAKKLRELILLIFFIILVVGLLFALWLGNTISQPLKQLVLMMNLKARKAASSPYEFKMDDEVGQIGNRFIRMLSENDELHSQMIRSLLKQKESEVKALQAQINPHFLYNTLESLNWLALSKNQFEISEVVRSLGNFFRLTINKGNQMITIEQELDHAISYVKVQRFRYKDKFSLITEVDINMFDFKIPKFILQPLVENAIYHGLKLKEGQGTIMVAGEISSSMVVFRITDDGEGMEPERLRFIQDSFYNEESTVSYGLKNVHERLKLKFGDEYGLLIASERGLYTTVTVRLPIITSEMEEDNLD